MAVFKKEKTKKRKQTERNVSNEVENPYNQNKCVRTST